MTLSKHCAQCDQPFYKKVTTSLTDWEETKYCSRACYWLAKVQPPKVYTCQHCGQPFSPNWSGLPPVYCSTACRQAAQRQPLPLCEMCGESCSKHGRRFCSASCKVRWYRGERVYNYLGENFRKDAYPIDYTFWTARAAEVRERDKVCQHCGLTPEENGRALDVHHIVPYRVTQDNSPENLITLCRACHKKADAALQK